MKPSGDRDEICYPFIYETSSLCDFEVATDELSAELGAARSLTPEDMPDVAADLDRLQLLALHVNGSIRGRLAVDEADLAWLRDRFRSYREEVRDRVHGFVLPRGQPPVPELHRARSTAKRAVRLMVRVEEEGKEVPLVLPRFCNVMCNFLFALTLVINKRRGVPEVPFVSRSYG